MGSGFLHLMGIWMKLAILWTDIPDEERFKV